MPLINLRIRGRLFAGFGALILFGVALAGFAVWQLGEIQTQVESLSRQSASTIRVGEIVTDFQAIRRGILRYVLDQDEKSFAESETRLAKVADLLELAVRTAPNEERRASYQIGRATSELQSP